MKGLIPLAPIPAVSNSTGHVVETHIAFSFKFFFIQISVIRDLKHDTKIQACPSFNLFPSKQSDRNSVHRIEYFQHYLVEEISKVSWQPKLELTVYR